MNIFHRSLLLIFSVALLGLPLNRWMDLAALALLGIIISTFKVVNSRKQIVFPLAILITAIGLKTFIPSYEIQEDHNIFLYQEDRSNVFESGLPSPVYSTLKQQFETHYPKEESCTKGSCWRLGAAPREVYAWSADGVWNDSTHSRTVNSINFKGILQLRLGAVNKPEYNFMPRDNDIMRKTMPYFVRYAFPIEASGGNISWKRTIIWNEGDQYQVLTSSDMATKTIDSPNTTIYGIGIDPTENLSIKFTPPSSWRLFLLIRDLLIYGTIAFVSFLLGRELRWLDIKIPVLSVVAGVLTVIIFKSNLLMGLSPQGGGADGIVHEGFGRTILYAALNGNFYEAFRGGESVYYFMPGLRYFYALQKLFFGETNFGFVLLGLFYGVIVYNFLRLFLPHRWAFGAFLMFEFTPILGKFGMSLPLYIKRIDQSLAEPLGNGLFMIGTTILFKAILDKKEPLWIHTYFAHLIFAFSIFVRPQICIPVAVLMCFAFWKIVISEKRYKQWLAPALGLLPVFLITFHNWYFGHEFVPLTAADMIPETLPTPPSTYWLAIKEIIGGQWSGAGIQAVLEQIYNWNKGREFYRLLPFAIFIYTAFRKNTDYWLRAFTMMGLSMHIVLMFYLPAGRYAYMAWMVTFIVFLVYLQREFIPYWQARKLKLKAQTA